FVNATLLYVVGRDPSPELGEDEAGAEHFAALTGRRPASADTAGERKRPTKPVLPSPRTAASPRAAARKPVTAGAPLAAGDVPESAPAAGQDRESAAAGAPPSAAAPAAEAPAPGDAPGEEGASGAEGTAGRDATPRPDTPGPHPPSARTVPTGPSARARTPIRARTTPLARTRSEPHQEHTTRRTPAPAAAGRGGPSSRAVRAGCGSGRVGRGLEDLDREGLPVGGRVVDGVADLRAVDRGAQRRLRGEHLERVVAVGDLAVAQQAGALLAGHGDLHDHAGLDDAVVLRGLADHGVLQEPLEVRDARFQLALLL